MQAKYSSTFLASDEPVWVMKAPLGHNLWGKMIRDISVAAGLDTVYTNHCVHVTSIVNMKASGIKVRKICVVSGYWNVQCLDSSG